MHLLFRLPDASPRDFASAYSRRFAWRCNEAERLDVHWTYTNIYLMDAANSILGGQALNLDAVRRRGEQRLIEWAERTKEEGAPHEFNSPTYSAVQINALAAIAQFAEDDATRRLAGEMEQFVWRHVARYWHAPTMQLGRAPLASVPSGRGRRAGVSEGAVCTSCWATHGCWRLRPITAARTRR